VGGYFKKMKLEKSRKGDVQGSEVGGIQRYFSPLEKPPDGI